MRSSPRGNPPLVTSARKAPDLQPGGHSLAQPVSLPDLAARQGLQQRPAINWDSITFMDVPQASYDHMLREVVKGMLHQSVQQFQQSLLMREKKSSVEKPLLLADVDGEPIPQRAGDPSDGTPPLADGSSLGLALAPIHARLESAYDAVIADLAVFDRSSEPSHKGPASGATATRSFTATLSVLTDHRVKQLEMMLRTARDELDDARNQIDELRRLNRQYQDDLTRSFREYALVQQRILELHSKGEQTHETAPVATTSSQAM